ncbi:hypothetical protein [Clostridium sp. LP20]|uniref:hypothetical protein n=1 Tax=Clostridium sp. LP20 TaxID=3418665 RepID=UPI003EE5623C
MYNWDYIEANSVEILKVLKNVFYQFAGYIQSYYNAILVQRENIAEENARSLLVKEKEVDQLINRSDYID